VIKLAASARQPSLDALGSFVLACRAVARAASEGWWTGELSQGTPNPLKKNQFCELTSKGTPNGTPKIGKLSGYKKRKISFHNLRKMRSHVG
jgi:hypothetical protein